MSRTNVRRVRKTALCILCTVSLLSVFCGCKVVVGKEGSTDSDVSTEVETTEKETENSGENSDTDTEEETGSGKKPVTPIGKEDDYKKQHE